MEGTSQACPHISGVAAYPEYRNKKFERRKKIASKYTKVAKKYFAINDKIAKLKTSLLLQQNSNKEI